MFEASFANEFPTSYAVSQSTRPIINESEHLAYLLLTGKHVVIKSETVFCKITNEVLGSTLVILAIFDDYVSANKDYKSRNPELVNHEDYAIALRSPKPPAF
jgi:hypothetical protein